MIKLLSFRLNLEIWTRAIRRLLSKFAYFQFFLSGSGEKLSHICQLRKRHYRFPFPESFYARDGADVHIFII